MTNEEIRHIFQYHSPGEVAKIKHESITRLFIALAEELNLILPEGPGKTVSIRKLSEARMQANSCVALDGKF